MLQMITAMWAMPISGHKLKNKKDQKQWVDKKTYFPVSKASKLWTKFTKASAIMTTDAVS